MTRPIPKIHNPLLTLGTAALNITGVVLIFRGNYLYGAGTLALGAYGAFLIYKDTQTRGLISQDLLDFNRSRKSVVPIGGVEKIRVGPKPLLSARDNVRAF